MGFRSRKGGSPKTKPTHERPLDINKCVLKAEISILSKVHPLAIFGVVPFPIVLPSANGFPTCETHCLFSRIPYVSLAFVLVVKNVPAYITAPLPLGVAE